MATTRSHNRRSRRPATTELGQENQLISLASSLAEKQLMDGTASSQVITHFLKLASSREKLEQERLKNENLLLSAKVDQIRSQQHVEELYAEALSAMRQYAGREFRTFEDDEYEEEP
jgi:hypothetical protein